MEDKKILLDNIDKIHTTEMGVDRIKRNLKIDTADVVESVSYTHLQNKSRFQSDKAANPLFFSGTSYGTATFLFAQRQRRDEPCGNGNDCRYASLLLGCHV